MKKIGIICEYNPFHHGHEGMIRQIKSLYPDSIIVAIMGGSFSQRGEAYLSDRHTRASWAMTCGVDAVVEMPSISSMLPAEKFAYMGVKCANILGLDSIAFGSECGDIDSLVAIASLMHDNTDAYANIVKSNLDKGYSYPVSIEKAVLTCLDENKSKILRNPNDTLAISYIKAIYDIGANICPIAILRTDKGYHNLDNSESISSATAIRQDIIGSIECVPDYVYRDIKNIDITLAKEKQDLYALMNIQCMSVADLAKIYDMKEGLENKFFTLSKRTNSLDELLDGVKSKRYTYSRLKRIATYCAIKLTDDEVDNVLKTTKVRLLCAKRDVMQYLQNVITCYKDISSPIEESIWQRENNLSSLRATIYSTKYDDINKNTIYFN